MPRSLPVLLAALLVCACACAAREKQEAASLTIAVDRYRHADATNRAAEAQSVSAVGCTDARVCAAKQACVEAIDPTTRALDLKDEVARGLQALQEKRMAPDSPEAQALPAKLDEAERLLKEGRTKMSLCDTKLAELHVAFGL